MQKVSTVTTSDHNREYWICQIGGWGALAIFSILSLNIWYTPGELAPVIHSVLQSITGLILSSPLRYLARRTWDRNVVQRMMLNGLGVLLIAALWTVWRVKSFTWLTGDFISMSDWGGWINVSVIVYVAWTVSYHALKYYRQSMEQKQLATEARNLALEAQAKAQRDNLKRSEAEKLFNESQLRMLKYQLNPHFFLNALNSVSALVRKDRKDEAMQMLAKIGDFLRLSLDDSNDLFHTIEEELDAIQSYLNIEKIRFGDRLITEFNIDPDTTYFEIPTLLLQPVFENAIKHAVSKNRKQTRIKFESLKIDDTIHLRIHDDGDKSHIDTNNSEKEFTGIGLNNVRNRLESAFGENSKMRVFKSPETGFTVDISILTHSS